MSDLSTFRDHCRTMAAAKHKSECHAAVKRRSVFWDDLTDQVHPDPDCGGCLSDADRALFALLAAEVDDYLAPQPDLFGDLTDEPNEARTT